MMSKSTRLSRDSEAYETDLTRTGTEAAQGREVRVRTSVYRVCNINTTDMTFQVECFLEASWLDPRLKDPSGSLTPDPETSQQMRHLHVKERPDESFFTPRLTFANVAEKNYDAEEQWFVIFDEFPEKVGQPPVVCLRWRFKTTFQQQMDFQDFPCGNQDLVMVLVSHRPATPELPDLGAGTRLRFNLKGTYRSYVDTDTFVFKSEYSLSPRINFEEDETDPKQSASLTPYSRLKIRMNIEYRKGYWLWNVVLPVALFTLLATASFALEANALNDRINTVIGMLLTTVAYKLNIASSLPQINYLTLIDWYLLGMLLAQAAMIALHVAAAEDRWDALGGGTAFLYAALAWLIVHVLCVVWLLWYQRREHGRGLGDWWVEPRIMWLGPLAKEAGDDTLRQAIRSDFQDTTSITDTIGTSKKRKLAWNPSCKFAVKVWDAQAAADATNPTDFESNGKQDRTMQQYQAEGSRFAVVAFKEAADALSFRHAADGTEGLSWVKEYAGASVLRVEELMDVWRIPLAPVV